VLQKGLSDKKENEKLSLIKKLAASRDVSRPQESSEDDYEKSASDDSGNEKVSPRSSNNHIIREDSREDDKSSLA